MVSFQDVLVYLLYKYRERYDRSPTKTKLLKLAYLGELVFYRFHRKRLTNADWIYYLFGPWTKSYDVTLESGPFELEKGSEPDSEAHFVKLLDVPEPHLTFDEKVALSGVVADFGNWELNQLLDHVYFDTEPMLVVQERGDKIDFSTAKPADFFRRPQVSLDQKTLAKIREKYRAMLRNAKEL